MAPLSLDEFGNEVEAALPDAAQAMQRAARWLSCQDQHQDLTAAVDQVLHALRGELSKEQMEERKHLRIAAQRDLINVGVDVLVSLFISQYQTSRHETEPAPPFGKVLVGVGPEGIPDGLRVFNISGLARSSGILESVVEKQIAAQGNVMLAPKAFEQLAAWLQTEVSAGRIGLPYHPQAAGYQ